MFGISRNAGIKSEVFIGIGINAFTVRGLSTRRIANANTFGRFGDNYRFRTNPLKTKGTIFTAGFAEESKF